MDLPLAIKCVEIEDEAVLHVALKNPLVGFVDLGHLMINL
jgi:hypothetical protein